jgi:hypothetical protein
MREMTDRPSRWQKTFILTAFFLLVGYSNIVPEAEAAEPDQSGKSTRYWDCCKPSASWSGKAAVSKPVNSCAKDGKTVVSAGTKSGCDGGTAFMCANQQPWAVTDTLAYGFAAASIAGGNESTWSCACYQLTFTSGTASGKKMVVQVTNTGSDLGSNHFDLQIPGGGVGIFNGCSAQYGAPSDGWGARYGGISNVSQCAQLPADLRPGCQFRFGWFNNADNPNFTFHRVKCPTALTAKSGCVRNDDASQPSN